MQLSTDSTVSKYTPANLMSPFSPYALHRACELDGRIFADLHTAHVYFTTTETLVYIVIFIIFIMCKLYKFLPVNHAVHLPLTKSNNLQEENTVSLIR